MLEKELKESDIDASKYINGSTNQQIGKRFKGDTRIIKIN